MVGRDAYGDPVPEHGVGDDLCLVRLDIDGGDQIESICQDVESPQVRFRHAAATHKGQSSLRHGGNMALSTTPGHHEGETDDVIAFYDGLAGSYHLIYAFRPCLQMQTGTVTVVKQIHADHVIFSRLKQSARPA